VTSVVEAQQEVTTDNQPACNVIEGQHHSSINLDIFHSVW